VARARVGPGTDSARMSGRPTFLDDVPGLRDLAIRQSGVVRRSQLRECGVSRQHIAHQVAAGRWQTLGPNVVVLSNGVLSRLQWMQAGVCHVGPRGALDGWTRLELAGLRGWIRTPIHVATDHGRREPAPPGLVVHQSRHLDPVDIVEGPLRSVTVARAAIDAAGWLPTARSACGLVTAVAQQKLASPEEMLEVLARIYRVRHTAALREALSDAAAGAQSNAERDVHAMMRSAGLRDIRRQFPVMLSRGLIHVDLAATLPDGRVLVVEVDGPHHDDPEQRARDAERDAELLALGYTVLHIPRWLVQSDPDAVRARLLAIRQGARIA